MNDKQKAIVGLGLVYNVVNGDFYDLDGKLIELSTDEMQRGLDAYNREESLGDLKIFDYINKDLDPLTTDFSIVGLQKTAPLYKQGRKIKAEYRCMETSKLVVSKEFTDIVDEFGVLTTLQVKFMWYDRSENVAISKTENVKYYNKAEAEFVLRKRRERSLDFLVSEGKNTPIEPIMTAMFDHYYDELMLYRQTGSDALKDAILNETDETILYYLGLRVPLAADPLNYTLPIKESILHQIFAITDEELDEVIMPV